MQIETVPNLEDATHFSNQSSAQEVVRDLVGTGRIKAWTLRLPEGTPGTEYVLSPTRPIYSEDDGPFVIVISLDRKEIDGEVKPRRMEYLSEVIN